MRPDGFVTNRHNKMLTSRLHSVGITVQIEVSRQAHCSRNREVFVKRTCTLLRQLRLHLGNLTDGGSAVLTLRVCCRQYSYVSFKLLQPSYCLLYSIFGCVMIAF